jgi:hypothetical protein
MSGQGYLTGRSKWELDTPSLMVDLPTMERSIDRVAACSRESGVGWRSHMKAIQDVPSVGYILFPVPLIVPPEGDLGSSVIIQ